MSIEIFLLDSVGQHILEHCKGAIDCSGCDFFGTCLDEIVYVATSEILQTDGP